MRKVLILSQALPPKASGVSTYVEHIIKLLSAENAVTSSSKSFLRAAWVSMARKIGIIFINDAWLFRNTATLMRKLFKMPFIIFSHGSDIKEAAGSRYKLYRLSRVAKMAESIVVDSEYLKSHWLKYLPQLKDKIIVAYPCPDPDFFNAPDAETINSLRKQYALEGKRVLLTISALTEGKGIPHLLRIMPEILKLVPNLVWILIGDGPKKQIVLEMIQRNNLQNVVRFLGEIPHNELKKFYYLSDLFVLLTHPDEGKEEGVGMVFLESAACGLPVVAGKSGGVSEAVRDDVTGILVDIYQGDRVIMQDIVGLLRSPEQLKLLGEEARLHAQCDFKCETILAKIKQWL